MNSVLVQHRIRWSAPRSITVHLKDDA